MIVVVVVTVTMLVRMVIVLAGRLEQIVAGRELVHTAPLERILGLEEGTIDGERPLQVEGADVQHLVDGDIRILRAMNLRRAVDGADAPLDAFECGLVDQIGLVEQHQIGEGHLLGRLVELIDVL